ncbi:hypothetical protein GQX74_011327 [Glossina fuscipes]|nr:hypothetical protein GQX74_011327 [Glossina fuscipes]
MKSDVDLHNCIVYAVKFIQKNGGINQYTKSVLFIANSSNHYYCSANHTIEKKFLKLVVCLVDMAPSHFIGYTISASRCVFNRAFIRDVTFLRPVPWISVSAEKASDQLLSSSNSGVTGDGVGAAGAPSFASTSTSGHSVWVPMVCPNSLLFVAFSHDDDPMAILSGT